MDEKDQQIEVSRIVILYLMEKCSLRSFELSKDDFLRLLDTPLDVGHAIANPDNLLISREF